MHKRIDPPNCGCTDCLTGYSVSIDRATEIELGMCEGGTIQNASTHNIRRVTTYVWKENGL